MAATLASSCSRTSTSTVTGRTGANARPRGFISLATRCEVQVAYAIGVAHPVGLFVQTFGTGVVPDEQIAEAVKSVFDLRPAAIVMDLDLLRPVYAQTAAYGHFGRELPDFTWESTTRADALAAAVKG